MRSLGHLMMQVASGPFCKPRVVMWGTVQLAFLPQGFWLLGPSWGAVLDLYVFFCLFLFSFSIRNFSILLIVIHSTKKELEHSWAMPACSFKLLLNSCYWRNTLYSLELLKEGPLTFACKHSWQDWQAWYIYILPPAYYYFWRKIKSPRPLRAAVDRERFLITNKHTESVNKQTNRQTDGRTDVTKCIISLCFAVDKN